MSPRDCTSSDQSSTSSFHRSLSDEESDCCGKTGSGSVSDTLSLTCDESMTSSLSSSSIVDNTIDESSDSELIDIYQSPHLLRRRLLPLAPSPIINAGLNSPIHRKPFDERTLWKKHPTTRILWFTLALTTYFLAAAVDYRSVIENLQEHSLSKESREWRRFFRRRAPKILHKLPSRSSSLEFTIRIRGHRVDLVTQSLDFHAQCPSVKDVQVEWTDKSTSEVPASLLRHKSGKVKPLGKPSTPAVLLVDEDLILTCQEIERGKFQGRPSSWFGHTRRVGSPTID